MRRLLRTTFGGRFSREAVVVALAIGVMSVFGLAQASARTACLSNGAVKSFTLTLPNASFAATAGTPFTATVTALTSSGCQATSYNGSGTLTSNLAHAAGPLPNGTDPTVPSPINFSNGISSPPVTAVKAVSDGSAKLTFTASGFTAVTSPGFSVNPGPPDHVEFSQQPNFNGSSSWLLNDQFSAQVTIYDRFENVATQENDPNAVTLDLNPPAPGLGGKVNVGSSVLKNGVDTFTKLTVTQTDLGYTLTASYGNGVTTATSAPFSVYLTKTACGGACSISQFNVDKNTTAQVQGNGSFAFLGVATVDFTASGTLMPDGCQTLAQDYPSGSAPAPVVVADMRTALGGSLDVTYGVSKALLQKLFGSNSGSQFIPICVGARRIALDEHNQVVAVPCDQPINGQPQTPWVGKKLDGSGRFDQTLVSPAICDSNFDANRNPLDPGAGYWWAIIGSFQDATNSNPALEIDPSVNPTVTGWTSGTTYRFFTLQFHASSAIGTPAQITAFENVPWDSWAGG